MMKRTGATMRKSVVELYHAALIERASCKQATEIGGADTRGNALKASANSKHTANPAAPAAAPSPPPPPPPPPPPCTLARTLARTLAPACHPHKRFCGSQCVSAIGRRSVCRIV